MVLDIATATLIKSLALTVVASAVFTSLIRPVRADNPRRADDDTPKNVLGTDLQRCSLSSRPVTGYHRDGYCNTADDDYGTHSVCATVTSTFLRFSRSRGNDLITPHPPFFPGLSNGDRWCLCANRWVEANEAGVAPPVVLEATHEKTLQFATLQQLQQTNAEQNQL